MKSVFLTGATGLLGRYLLRQLLLSNRSVAVLARGGADGIAARDRVDDSLRPLEEQLRHRTLPRPAIVEGQLHAAGLGLSASDRRWVSRHCSTVLHSAASITFEQDGAHDEPYRSNVAGTQQLLEFCTQVGIREFHHVSTAYVCGDRQGRVFENDFDQGQKFRNDYERSKYLAEQLLRQSTGLASLTIYRPSIIVGDAETAYSSTFHGFYLPLQLAHLATSAGFLKDRSSYMNALGLQGGERKNLVPVNWVAEVLVHILQQPPLHGRTYHLTNPHPVTSAEIDGAIAESIRDSRGGRNPSMSISAPTMDGFRKQMQVYKAYLGDDPDFDVQHTQAAAPGLPCPRLDHTTLVRLGRYAIDVRFGWPRQRPRPVVLDVDKLMRQLPSGDWSDQESQPTEDRPHSSARTLRFEVSGSFGGTWEVLYEQSKVAGARMGCTGASDASGYLNVHTLCDILAGTQTVSGAITSGQLVLESLRDRFPHGPTLLEALFQRLRQLPDTVGSRVPRRELLNESSRNIHLS